MKSTPIASILVALVALPAVFAAAGCEQEPCVVYTFRYTRSASATGYLNYMESSSGKRIAARFGTDKVSASSGQVMLNPTSCRIPEAGQQKWTVDVWISPEPQGDMCSANLSAPGCYPTAAWPRGIATFDWPAEGKKSVTVGLE